MPTNAEHEEAATFAALDAALDDKTPAAVVPETKPEAAAASPVTPEPSVKPDAGSPPQPSATPTEPTPFDNWLSKYGGDKNKAGEHAWEATSRFTAVEAERDRLRQELEEARRAPVTPEAPSEPEVHPQVAQYDNELRAIEARSMQVIQTAAGYRQQSNQYQAALEQGGHQLRSISDALAAGGLEIDQENALRKQYRELVGQLAGIERQKQAFDAATAGLNQEAGLLVTRKQTAEALRSQAEMLVRLSTAREAEESRRMDVEYQASVAKDASDYRTFYGSLAQELQIPEKQHARFRQYIAGPLIMELQTLESQGNQQGFADIKAKIRERALDYKAMLDEEFTARSANYTKTKTGQIEREAPTGAAAVATPSNTRQRRHELEDYESIQL